MANDLNIDVPIERVRSVKRGTFGADSTQVSVRVVRYDAEAGAPAEAVTLVSVTHPAYARPLASDYRSTDPDLAALAESVIARVVPTAVLADALSERAETGDRSCRGAAAYRLRLADETIGYVPPAPRVHVTIWYSGVVRFTDMTNAGRRGKVCQEATIHGAMPNYAPGTTAEYNATEALIAFAEGVDSAREFADVWQEAWQLFRSHFADAERGPLADSHVQFGVTKGVDAPRAELRAGVAGLWAAKASNDGTWVERLDDTNNWTQTSRGKAGAAYDKVAKVWDKVKAAKTFAEVVALFEAAGLDLRGYCGMD